MFFHQCKLIYDELLLIKHIAKKNWNSVEADVKKWMSTKSSANKKVKQLETTLAQRQSDLQNILLERIRDKEHAEIYTDMLKKCEADIENCKTQIESIRDYDTTIRKRKAEMKQNIDLIDEIVSAGAISDTHLRMLVDEITILEKDKKLTISISLKAEFRRHQDYYDDNGNINERSFECWWFSEENCYDHEDIYVIDEEDIAVG